MRFSTIPPTYSVPRANSGLIENWPKTMFADPLPASLYEQVIPLSLKDNELYRSIKNIRDVKPLTDRTAIIDHSITRYAVCAGLQFDTASIYEDVYGRWGTDVMVCIAEPIDASPNFNYYDIVTKPKADPNTPKPVLKKVTIYYRHANRYPITEFECLNEMAKAQGIEIQNGQLTAKGHEAARTFGQHLTTVYNLEPLIGDVSCFTSPIERCIETAICIQPELGTSEPIHVKPVLGIIPTIDDNLVTDVLDELHAEVTSVITKVQAKCGVADTAHTQAQAFLVISELMTTMVSYTDIGVDVEAFLGKKLKANLERVSVKAYNWLNRWQAQQNQELLKQWFDVADQCSSKLVLCATHDFVIFTMAHDLAIKYGYPGDLKMPGYLSSIRIEYWSDGVRIFYNNILMN